jgi:hypothetical protein
MNDVTGILSAIEHGDPHAAAQLLPLVYDELRRLAAQKLAHENPGQTLQATALVHEAYLRLVADGDASTRREPWPGLVLYLMIGRPTYPRWRVLRFARMPDGQEPSKPSTKLSTAEGLPTLAANRGTEPAKLTALVRGELDWIVMKALEKDRNRRYDTANGFAMDVQRYLADEPVLAGPPSVAYRLRKFVKRTEVRCWP